MEFIVIGLAGGIMVFLAVYLAVTLRTLQPPQ